jgi:hypothetical protein
VVKLRDALEAAEVKDGEVDEMKLRRSTVGAMLSAAILGGGLWAAWLEG